MTAMKTIAAPKYSLRLIVSPWKRAPPITPNTDSRESITEATAGLTCF